MTGPNTRTTQISISRRDNVRQAAQGFSPLGYVVDGMAVVDSLYSGYGERSDGGMRAGKQQHVMAEDNAYLDRECPLLDHLIGAAFSLDQADCFGCGRRAGLMCCAQNTSIGM